MIPGIQTITNQIHDLPYNGQTLWQDKGNRLYLGYSKIVTDKFAIYV